MTLRSAPVVSVHLQPGTLHDHITEPFLLTLRLLYLNPLSNTLLLRPPRLPSTNRNQLSAMTAIRIMV